jgi:hypothetical protein
MQLSETWFLYSERESLSFDLLYEPYKLEACNFTNLSQTVHPVRS